MKVFATILLASCFSAALSYTLSDDSDEHGVLPGRRSTSCKCGWANKFTSRIVGGRETGVNQYPWIAGLVYRTVPNDPFCGGTIITENHVLTAAHCTEGLEYRDLAIVAGEHNVLTSYETDATQVINVRQIDNHERYNLAGRLEHDIAILTLDKSIKFSQKVGPACMPTSMNQFDLFDKDIKVIGWGLLSENGEPSMTLQQVNLKGISLSTCQSVYRQYRISDGQFCTYRKNKDSCQGDSGGPLTYVDPETNRYTLVGAVSFGFGCARAHPGVNTNVAAYLDWIQRTIRRSRRDGQTCSRI